jgi:hypothetical protein
MANTHKKIQTVTVGAGGAASIAFTSIPQTYTDLVIRLSGRSSNPYIDINFNSLATNFYALYGGGTGTALASGTQAKFLGAVSSTSNTANAFGSMDIVIANYASSQYKVYRATSAQETNATAAEMYMVSGLWSNTAAITSVQIIPAGSGTFSQYTTATLYGVFKENVSGAPSAPTSVTATGSELTASVAFTPAGQTASLYTVTSSPGSITATGTSSPIVVSGLTEGQAYTFTVTAANPLGTSAASSASNSITAATTIFYMTSSQTFTPPSYPFSYTAYVVGGGGTGGNNGTYTAGNTTYVYLGSGGGSGFYTTGNGTINSGNATVTIGTGGSGGTIQGVGGGGGTSTFHNYNALGGNGGASSSDAGGTVNVPQSIGGGNGGSGGGGAGWYNINAKNGNDNSASAVGGAGGSSGASGGAGNSRPGGTGQGGSDSKIPSGAGGPLSGATPNYAGISVSGSNTAYGAGDYANGRGMGGVNASAGTSGFVLVKRNA